MILDGNSTSVYYRKEQTHRPQKSESFIAKAAELHTTLRERLKLGPPQISPRCENQMMVDARRSLEALSCETCAGLFVARPSSDIVADALGVTPAALERSQDGSATCASCFTPMRSVDVDDRELDVCGHCGAIFFDYTEADDIPGLMKA